MSRCTAAKLRVAIKRIGSVIAYETHTFVSLLLPAPDRSVGRELRVITETTNTHRCEWRIAKAGNARIG